LKPPVVRLEGAMHGEWCKDCSRHDGPSTVKFAGGGGPKLAMLLEGTDRVLATALKNKKRVTAEAQPRVPMRHTVEDATEVPMSTLRRSAMI
jgi:hypothetical protein